MENSEAAPPAGTQNPFVGNNMIRIYVNLSNGARIVVPVDAESTVAQLTAECSRRATVLNLPDAGSVDNELVLRLCDGTILFGEDNLADVLDLNEENTLYLGPAVDIPSISSMTSPTHTATPSIVSYLNSEHQSTTSRDSKIYIRWITAGRALDHTRLKSLPADRTSLQSSTTVAELKEIAFKRLYTGNIPDEDKPVPDATAELFLSNCHLSSLGRGSKTLGDLELQGSKHHPLDIFVVLIRKNYADATRPDHAWAFRSTERGTATFQTCCDIFRNEVTKGRIKLEKAMQVLWDTTHFPPTLLALQQLHQAGTKQLLLPNAIFASAFRELCLRVVPPWVSPGSDSVLESSRQVFAWIRNLAAQISDDACQALVHKVELREVQSTTEGESFPGPGTLEYDECINFEVQGIGGLSSETCKALLSKDRLDNVRPELLAAALWGAYQSPYNFYFDLPPDAVKYLDHKRAEILDPQEFDDLVQTTNQIDGFKMIGPEKLGACTASTLPVITLDSSGYVSIYDQQDKECSEREFYTSNVFRKEVLSGSDPAQYLLQKLRPIIDKRKAARTWDVDSWHKDAKTVDSRYPEEAVVICVDKSSSMAHAMGADWNRRVGMPLGGGNQGADDLHRLSEVKEVFKNLVSRISAYRLPTHLGLVTFSTREDIRIEQELTPVLYDFQHQLDNTIPGGSTAIFDALMTANDMLTSFEWEYPRAQRRIVLLTDGEDNQSKCQPEEVCRELYNNDIVLDAIVIGSHATKDLFRIAKHTGGYAFNPGARDLLFQIFLLDGCIDIRARPDIKKVAIDSYSSSWPKPVDMKTKYDIPPCRAHPNEKDQFISLQEACKFFSTMSKGFAKSMKSGTSRSSSVAMSITGYSVDSGSTAVSSVDGQGRKFLNEVMAMINNPHDSMDVYVSESNMGFWKVVMQGPPGSPYEKGTFLLYVDIGDSYPTKAPTAKFITPVLHPNITKHGRICHEIFTREWQSGIRIYQVLQHIWAMLFSLEARDAVDPFFTLQFWTDPEGGRREVDEYIKRFALKTRAQLSDQILGLATDATTPSNPTSFTNPRPAPPPVSAVPTPTAVTTTLTPTSPTNTRSSNRLTLNPFRNYSRAGSNAAPLRSPGSVISLGSNMGSSSAVSIATLSASSGSGGGTGSKRSAFFRRFGRNRS
ncbi:MAG: hypothetical protein MMC33_007302 [Icmadophila ericetorum]|nr:hypothetical protein [Icmadophila ericetorum]